MKRLIQNGRVHRFEGERSVYERMDILIDGDTIESIEPRIPSPAAEEVIDAKNCIVFPGLINAHIHSFDTFYRGAFDNLPLELWIMKLRPFLSGVKLTQEYIYLRTLFLSIQLLKSGSTTVIDDLVQPPWNNTETLESILSAYEKAGLRANLASSVGNLPMHKAIPFLEPVVSNSLKERFHAMAQTPDADYLSYLQERVQAFNRPGRLQRYVLSVAGPQRTSVSLQKGIRSLAEKYDLPVVIHVLESRLQRAGSDLVNGKSLVRFLEENSILYENLNIIHSVWVDNCDIDLMAKRGCCVVHCPGSNFKLGSGMAPVEDLLKAGIRVCLGSDNPSCSDNMNLFEQIRMAAVIHKVKHSNFHTWVGAEDALRMATVNGAYCARQPEQIGTLERGKQADMIILNANNPTYIPENNYSQQIAFCENGSSVRDVIIAGTPVVRNREITTFDEQEVLDRVRDLTRQIHEELKNADEESRLIMDDFEQAYFTAHGMLKFPNR